MQTPLLRRHTLHWLVMACAACALLVSGPAMAGPRVGVLMLHGKNPGSAQDPNFNVLKPRLEREGMVVVLPDMPWSRSRYIAGGWDQAMEEMQGHVKALRDKGAEKIVLVGHSLGVPAALSFAARQGDVQALVLLAPGHTPQGYYGVARFQAVRESIDLARTLVADGKGDATERFNDNNQGRQQIVVMTARNYLSYFDPLSDAEMTRTASRVPATVPSLLVIGDQDPLFTLAKPWVMDKLPAHPKNQYLEVKATHLSTPSVASDAIVAWIKAASAD